MSARSRWLVIAVSILLIATTVQLLYDPIDSAKHALEIANLRAAIAQAQDQWAALNISNYTFEIEGNAQSICRPSAVIEVRNDVVVSVKTKTADANGETSQVLPPEKWADPDWGDEVFLCNFNHFTFTRMFDLLESTVRDHPDSIIKAELDLRYGFLAYFKYGLYVGYGLLSPQIGNCCSEFLIKNFHPLN